MDLQTSVFLLFLLFTAGHSLQCFECDSQTNSCADQKETACPAGSWCYSSTAATLVGGITSKAMSKGCTSDCQSFSLNYGSMRTTYSCCNTGLCNRQDPPDPVPNGKECYTCDEKSCSKPLSCTGDEDRCITLTDNVEGLIMLVKGCVSKNLCDAKSSVKNGQSISCCEGNLCNGAQSVTQSFLFLCCSLLSYFLLH
ncbi:hypothetical protein PO909_033936 [Leuciscus waleckii]